MRRENKLNPGNPIISRDEKYAVNKLERPKSHIPLHRQRKTIIADRPGYKTAIIWEKDREKFELAGWSAVRDKARDFRDPDTCNSNSLGSELKITLNYGTDARQTHGVVMEIPLDWYEQDFRECQGEIAKQSASLDPSKNQIGMAATGYFNVQNKYTLDTKEE